MNSCLYRATVLYLDCRSCAWEVVNQLFVQDSDVLCSADTLIFDLGPLPMEKSHYAHALYHHLFQELGFLGMQSVPLEHDEHDPVNQVLMPAHRVTLVNTQNACRMREGLRREKRRLQRNVKGGHMHTTDDYLATLHVKDTVR